MRSHSTSKPYRQGPQGSGISKTLPPHDTRTEQQEPRRSYIYHNISKLVGDFNAIGGKNSGKNWKLGPHDPSRRSENGERSIDLMSACHLFYGNRLVKSSNRRRTWESLSGECCSDFDHIFASRRQSLFDVSVLPLFNTPAQILVCAKILDENKIYRHATNRSDPLQFISARCNRSWWLRRVRPNLYFRRAAARCNESYQYRSSAPSNRYG